MQQTLPPIRLTPAERRSLRRVLARHFELEELRDWAFDLGTEYTVFHQASKRAFCREWVAYLERRERLHCLVTAVLERVQETDVTLVKLAARLPACTPSVRLQVVPGEGKDRGGFAGREGGILQC